MSSESQEIDETELNALRKAVDQAISQLEEFRIQEGTMLQHLFEEKIANIAHLLQRGRTLRKRAHRKDKRSDNRRFEQNRQFRLRQKQI